MDDLDPKYGAAVFGVVRGVVQLAAAFNFAWAAGVTGSQEMMAATVLVSVGSLVWSVAQKLWPHKVS